MSGAQKPNCFVIAPIGGNDSEIRKRSDKVLKHVFKRALAEKYEVIRGDEIDEPGMITSQVLRAVQEYDLVVADLTGHNPNVLYELAVRHAVEKPVIHVIEPKLSKIPFDIAGFRTIEFDLTDPDSIEAAVEQLKKQAEQAISGKWGETPVKLANLMARTTEDSPQMLLLKQAVQGIADISAKVANLDTNYRRSKSSVFRWLVPRPSTKPSSVAAMSTSGSEEFILVEPPEVAAMSTSGSEEFILVDPPELEDRQTESGPQPAAPQPPKKFAHAGGRSQGQAKKTEK